MKNTVSVQERVAELVREHGSYRKVVEAIGVSRSVLQQIVAGKKPNDDMQVNTLRRLGLKVGPTYERLDGS